VLPQSIVGNANINRIQAHPDRLFLILVLFLSQTDAPGCWNARTDVRRLSVASEEQIRKIIRSPLSKLSNVVERLLRVSARIERWFRPRMPFFVANSAMMRIHRCFIMLSGLAAPIPLPLPFNNLVAAFPVLLLGISLLEEDGLLVIVSYLAAIHFICTMPHLFSLGTPDLRGS
jgi:hypothetical protein